MPSLVAWSPCASSSRFGPVSLVKKSVYCAGGKIESSKAFARNTAGWLALIWSTCVAADRSGDNCFATATAPSSSPTRNLVCMSDISGPGRPTRLPRASSAATACRLTVSFASIEAIRSAQPLRAPATLIRGSRAAASSDAPAPYEMPTDAISSGSAGVCASAQSITELTSAMVGGPSMSICPPDS